MDINKPKIISLFSGAGGLDIGFEKAGFRTVYATDVWQTACDTLQKNNMADEVFCGDVRDIDFKSLKEKYGDIDCLIGGPPCPPHSQTRHYLIGKADGFDDEHAGFAVPEYFRALESLSPKIFFFENVDGFTFKTHQYEFDFLKKTGSNSTPLLLLDDIFDKLDASRVEQIVKLVAGDSFGQIFITDTNREHLDRILHKVGSDYKMFRVEQGEIAEMKEAEV